MFSLTRALATGIITTVLLSFGLTTATAADSHPLTPPNQTYAQVWFDVEQPTPATATAQWVSVVDGDVTYHVALCPNFYGRTGILQRSISKTATVTVHGTTKASAQLGVTFATNDGKVKGSQRFSVPILHSTTPPKRLIECSGKEPSSPPDTTQPSTTPSASNTPKEPTDTQTSEPGKTEEPTTPGSTTPTPGSSQTQTSDAGVTPTDKPGATPSDKDKMTSDDPGKTSGTHDATSTKKQNIGLSRTGSDAFMVGIIAIVAVIAGVGLRRTVKEGK
ncbi:MAG: hypothetical protein Q4P66_10120 [Actinomycetaceae bacterium]|nr:hypothetical protein [Actinomycetaceae bacterium]